MEVYLLLGCRHYTGDCAIVVSMDPVAFCLEWGVTAGGNTVLVETNDGFAFGHYGLHPGYVAHMLSARWLVVG